MKKSFLLVPLAIILVMSLFLVSCEDEPEIKTYKVTFLKDKGDTTPYDEKIVLEGSGITEAPKEPTDDGRIFEYWKLNDGDSEYKLDTPVKSNLTLVAEWKTKEFTVSFMDGEEKAAEPQTVECGKTATAPTAPTKEGHTFQQWTLKDSEEEYSFSTPVTDNITLVPKWVINEYKVEFYDEDGTSLYSSVDAKHGQLLSEVAPTDVEKTGHVLIGWSTEKGSTTAYDSSKAIEGNLKLYPIWEKAQYKVSFICGEGAENVPQVQAVGFEEKVTEPEAIPTKTGYTFQHWSLKDSEEAYSFATPITDNITLVANWVINEYTVSFMDGEEKAADSQTVEYGKNATAPENPTKEGHTFSCWRKVGFNSPFDFETEVITENTVLEAVWDINTYTVTFKNADGTDYETKDVFYNGKVDKPEGTPTRGEGYLFKYWTLDNAVEGQKKEYSFDTPVVGNLVLYPVFIETFTVSFICGDGAENVPPAQTVESGDKATKPKDPTRTGYAFRHWAESKNSEDAYNFNTAITKNVELFAVYDTLKISVSFYDEKGKSISSSEYEWGKDNSFPIISNKADGFNYGWLLKGKPSPTAESSFNLPYSAKEYRFDVYITTDLLSIDKNGSVKATNTLKNSTDEISLSIPYSINGIKVTAIADYAFLNCSNLIKITIPETVTSMGTSVFANCRGLQSAVINANVNTLHKETFNSCDALKSISLSSTITEINGVMLGNLKNLESITVSENNPYLIVENGVLYSKDFTTLIHYPAKKVGKDYEIPNTVTIIGGQAFRYCKELERVTIPDTVTEIRVQSFSGCSNLTSIDIPNKVTRIGSYAFEGCTSLNSSITIPGTVTNIGQGAFLNCEKLESIVVDPSSITSLPGDLFKGCIKLTTIKVDQVNTAEYPSPIASNAPWGAPNVTKDQVQWKIVE